MLSLFCRCSNVGGQIELSRLTRALRLLALLRLPALPLAVLSSQLRDGGVAEADTGDETGATGDRAG